MSPLSSSVTRGQAGWRQAGERLRRLRESVLASKVRVRVHLAADALVACELEAGRLVRKDRFGFTPDDRHLAFQALREWMTARGTASKVSLEWVLGHAMVRYMLLPWTLDLVDSALRERYALALFEQQFKQDPRSHAMRFAAAGYGQPQLVACVTHSLLNELEAHASASGVSLRSVVPGVDVLWRGFGKLLTMEDGVVCLIDGDRRMLLHHVRGRIHEISLRPFDATAETAIPPITDEGRWRVLTTVALPQLSSELALVPGSLDGLRAKEDQAFALALCGADR